MSALLDRFNAERKAFERLKKQAESKVVRWKYWEDPDWYWDPEYRVQYMGPPQRAQKGKAEYAYGYDASNRVAVIHAFKVGDPSKLHAMEFLRYSGDRIIGSEFFAEAVYEGNKVVGSDWAAGGVLADVFEAVVEKGRIVRVEQLRSGYPPWDWKTIVWEGGQVAKVLEGMAGRKAHRQVTYSKTGEELEDLDLTQPVKRKPLPKGVTVQSLTKEIRSRLVKEAVAAVTKARIKEPAYCLAITYDCEGNPLLPPEFDIGLESGRRAWLKGAGRKDKLAIWNPDEPSMFARKRPALDDLKLNRACDLLNQELGYRGSDEPARKLILQVAGDLAKMDWKGKLNPTDDFIVYAVDTDLVDLRKNLKLTVPAKQLAKLKAAKLL